MWVIRTLTRISRSTKNMLNLGERDVNRSTPEAVNVDESIHCNFRNQLKPIGPNSYLQDVTIDNYLRTIEGIDTKKGTC